MSFCFRVWVIICTKGLFVGATYYLIYLVNGNKFLITNDCLRVRYKSYTFPGYDPRKLESAGNYSHIDFTQNFWRVIWLRLFISFICSSQWSNQRNSRMDDLMTPLMDDLMTLNEFGSELLSTWDTCKSILRYQPNGWPPSDPYIVFLFFRWIELCRGVDFGCLKFLPRGVDFGCLKFIL